jgi:hypothetical protein
MGAGLALMAGMLTGCGGDSGGSDDAPQSASKEDFCKAFEAVGSAGDDFDKGKEKLQELKDTGTPEDIPDNAREGFDLLMDAVADAESSDDASKALDDLSTADQKKVREFTAYTIKKCTDLGDLPSDIPSEMPSS